MAQNGLGGLDAECCLALAVVPMEEFQQQWMCEVFGAGFMDMIEIAVDSESEAGVVFPAHELPKLSVVQLDNGTACFGVQGMETPWWMIPEAGWQQAPVDTAVEARGHNLDALQLSPAEQLVKDYGHLEQGHSKKRRK